jgi:hypothetical protein
VWLLHFDTEAEQVDSHKNPHDQLQLIPPEPVESVVSQNQSPGLQKLPVEATAPDE